jgi:Fe-S cluster assembly ATP-binding protein
VLYRGQVIKSGDKSLALDLEREGYAGVIGEAA